MYTYLVSPCTWYLVSPCTRCTTRVARVQWACLKIKCGKSRATFSHTGMQYEARSRLQVQDLYKYCCTWYLSKIQGGLMWSALLTGVLLLRIIFYCVKSCNWPLIIPCGIYLTYHIIHILYFVRHWIECEYERSFAPSIWYLVCTTGQICERPDYEYVRM